MKNTKNHLKIKEIGDKVCDTISSHNEGSFFDNLITIEELSGNLGLSKKTLQNWVSLRKIPYVKIGRKVYFRSSRLQQWIERKEFKSCL